MESLTGEALDAKLRELLAEDLGAGDVTSEWTVPEQARTRGRLIERSACVVSPPDRAEDFRAARPRA
jgi:nicotinate-nucleotide pyrophosphorylase